MKIGFIGLGIMGKPMSKNLLKNGFELVICARRSTEALKELLSAGAEAVASPREVAERSEFIITMLPNSPEVKDVILGPRGIIEGAKPGSIVADMSSISPLVSRALAAELAQKKIELLDAPVSGGEPKAIAGSLSVMVGGKKEVFDKALPIFKAMAASVVLTGDIGAGNVTKLANQIIVALNIAAISEALVFATKAGVDPELVYQAIRGGLAGSAALEAKAPMMLARKIEPGFRVNLHIKDLANALQTAHDIGMPLPLTASIMETMQALKVDGLGNADHGAIVRYYERLAKAEVGR